MRRFKGILGVLVFIILAYVKVNSAFAADGTDDGTVRAGFFIQKGFFEKEGSKMSGYGVEVINRISQYTGFNVNYVDIEGFTNDEINIEEYNSFLYTYSNESAELDYDSLNKLVDNEPILSYPYCPYELLISGEIDFFISNSLFNEYYEKMDAILLSEYDIGSSSYLITVRKSKADLYPDSQYAEWDDIKIGAYEDSPEMEVFINFAEKKAFNYTIIPIQKTNDYDVFDAYPEIDAFVSTSFRDINPEKEVVRGTFGENFLYIATRADKKDLMNEINDSINKIRQYDPTCFSNLSKTYFKFDKKDTMLFTREEREYIEKMHSKSIYAIAYVDFKPYIYLNETNRYSGIIPEYIKLINEITGLDIKIIGKTSVNEYQYAVYSNSGSICLNERYDFDLAKAHDIRLTNSYIDVPICKVYVNGREEKSNCSGIYTINKGNNLSYLDKEKYGISELRAYTKAEDMLDDLIAGKIDYAYIPSHMITVKKSIPKYSNLAVDTLDDSIGFCIGVCNVDDLVLANIISKAANYISESKVQDIINAEMNNYVATYSIYDYLKEHNWILWTILWGSIVLVTIFVVLTLRTRNAERDKELAIANAKYYKTILSTNLFVIEVVLNDNEHRDYYYYQIEVDEKGEHVIKHQEYDADFNKFALKIHEDDIEDFKKMFSDDYLHRLVETKDAEYKEIRCKIEDDRYSYLGVTAQAVPGADKRVLLLVKDVSSAKIEEEEKRKTLQVALDTAKSMGDSKNTFLSQISHDLRTPMNAIVGMTALAQLNIDDEDKVKECLSTISNSSEHLLALLNDILDVTRIESGRFNFTQKRIRITTVLQNTILMLERKAKEYNVRLNVDITNVEHDYIISDENRLEQVFSNIISNAIKYSNNGGTVDVILKELNNKNDNEFYYDFIVEDHGIGMSDNTLEKLFVPFERGQEAIGKEGTGLGMTITKSIVDALGGIISVDSELGVGTKFVVSLSFSDDISASLAGVEDLNEKNAIIICEDKSMQNLLTEILLEGNMKVFTAVNPYEDVVMDNEFAVIAVSLVMPLEEELKILTDLRKKVGRKPIIFDVSYEDSNSTSEIAKSNKIDGFVSIPCYKENVTRLILDALESRKITKKIRIKKNQQGLNALIVEDVEINAIFAQAIAEMKGFQTTIASNGEEAVDILEKSGDGYYSIVFMDIQMPVMNGYEATKLIRKSKRKYLKEIPIIAMSANTFPEDIIKSRNAGMNDHISKPIDLNKFSDITDKYIIK